MPKKYDGPTYDKMFEPVLKAIKALGGSASNEKILMKVVELMGISSDTLAIKHSEKSGNASEVEYRLGWAKSYLKKTGYIIGEEKGVWALTNKGKQTESVNPVEIINKAQLMKAGSQESYWLVGASRGSTEDMTSELLAESIWQYWPGPKEPDKYREDILSMKPGDKIAIKSSYVRKHRLPFENNGHPVSVNGIKAVGIITENPGDGRHVIVNWTEQYEEPREWYFFTSRASVWKLNLQHETRGGFAKQLVDFAFNGAEQDYDYFIQDPYWGERYGDKSKHSAPLSSQFGWIPFYEEFATALESWKSRRPELLRGIQQIIDSDEVPYLEYLYEKNDDGERMALEDICPFTLMATFNRSITNENRRVIAAALARLIGVKAPIPESFDGIPVMNNQKSWFYAGKGKRESGDIDRLWQMFSQVLEYAEACDNNREESLQNRFASSYDEIIRQRGLRWTPTFGFYWARPKHFVPLDQNTRNYLSEVFEITFPPNYNYTKFTGENYIALLDDLKAWFDTPDAPVKSFSELSYAAWKKAEQQEAVHEDSDVEITGDKDGAIKEEFIPYTLKNILDDGCFIVEQELEKIIGRLKIKKNIILQGPPGTGKTWLSKRLAYALIGKRREPDVIAIQFHPSLSYEDFVRGWRPGTDGKLALEDGPLMKAVIKAREQPDREIVVIIEEVNRGNPAQIFGEMLTLLEADKREKAYGLRLSYMRKNESPVYVPANLYLIGTMNNADRSLAMMDYALRRRFSFFDLKPEFNDEWKKWLINKAGIPANFVSLIASRMHELNAKIATDNALGPDFVVGHSYVTPSAGTIDNPESWYETIVKNEIKPLLEEYWFDRLDIAKDQIEKMLA